MPRAQHPRAVGAGEVADQAGADHRAVGLVAGSRRAGRPARPRCRRRAVSSLRRVAADHEGRAARRPARASAPDQSRARRRRRRRETHCASASAGITSRSMPGPSLTPAGMRVGQAEGEVERRGVVRRRRASRVSLCPGRAAGRVEPDAVDAGRARRPRRRRAARCTAAERREVVGGDRGGDLVGVDRGDLEVERRERERVAADAAAEVGDVRRCPARGTARRAAPRPAGGSPARGPAR